MSFKFILTTHRFVTHKKHEKTSSISANLIPVLPDMNPMCKAKAAIRKFFQFENEKLKFELRFFFLFDLEN
jgi:hypothetical protein